MNNVILEQWKFFATVTDGYQKKYYERKLKDAHAIKCVSAHDVFTPQELERIFAYCQIEKRMCFRTAYRLANLFPDRVKYVEGEVTIFNGALGIEHAWNLVDGEHYVDLTFEFALQEDVTKEVYVALGEYDVDMIRDVACETQIYGDVWNHLSIKQIKK